MSNLCSLETRSTRRLGALMAPGSAPSLCRLLVGAALLAASVPGMAALSQSQVLTATDHTVDAPLNIVDERFGEAVAVSGNWMAVGAPGALDAAGSVSIYERVSGAWVWRQRLAAPAVQAASAFGAAVDIHEAGGLVTVIVGAPLFDAAETNQGRAFIFNDTDAGAGLSFATTVSIASNSELNGNFGASVALFGDNAAIGAPNNGSTDSGLVSIHGRNVGGSNAWGQSAVSKTGPAGSRFGVSVDLHGEYLIVGAPLAENAAALRTGAAYVYRQDQGGANAWGIKHTLSPASGQAGQVFGQSVGVWDSSPGAADSTSRSVVGAPLFDDGGTVEAGRVNYFTDGTLQTQFTGAEPNEQLGYSVALEGTEAIAGRPSRTISTQPNAGSVNTYFFNGTTWATNTINLAESGGNRNHFYGRSVDVSGTNAVIGAPGTLADALNAPPGAARAGSITTLVKPGPTWIFEAKRLAIYDQPFSQAEQFFGISSAITSEWMAIGARQDAQKGTGAGAVFMYRNVGGVWTPHSKLTALFGKAGDQFGTAVALQGTRLVVGAPSADGFPGGTSNAGAVYVFNFNGTVWGQTLERQSPNPSANGFFGSSVSLHGDVLAVGAHGENGSVGRAYAFRSLGDLSSPLTLNIPAAVNAAVGFSISVYDPVPGTANDESIAVGAYNDNSTAGSAFVLSGATFSTVTTLVNPAPGSNRFFGYAVSLFNGRVAVGAPTASAAPSGAAHVFSGAGYTSVQTLAPTGSPGQFGFAVALNDTELLVGAPAGNGRAGTAHRFLRSGLTWSQSDLLQPAGLAALDEFGSTVALAGGNYVVGAPLRDNVVGNSGVAYVFQQAPEVTVSPTSLSVSEAGPTSQSFAVSLSQAPASNVTVELTFPAQVQVDSGSGFGASPQTVTLTAANALTGVTVSVRAIDDAIAEANPHAATVTTSATTSADSRFNGLAVDDVAVSIADNDSPGIVVTESGGSTAVVEGGATDTYTVVLGSQPAGNVTVNLAFDAQLEVSVGAGPFTASPASIVFTPANATTVQTVTVRALNDTVVEGAQASTIVQTVTTADPLYSAINPADVPVGITDNDTATVAIAIVVGTVAESSATHDVTARLQIVANGAAGGTLGSAVALTPTLTAGSAGAGDFSALTTSYGFAAGAAHNSTETISVSITNDRLLEGPETFTVTQNLTSGPASASGSQVVTIADDESAVISWTGASGAASEATPAYAGAVAQLTVAGTGTGPLQLAPSNSVTAAFSAVAGTADSSDYSVGSSVVFPAGTASAATQTASVTVVNDALVEGDEAFQLQFGAVTGAGAVSAAGTHAVTIADNDSAVIGFATGDDTVGEAAGSFSKPVVLSLTTNGTGSPALQRAVTVPVATTPQTASTPADYALTTPSVAFAAGAVNGASQTATVSLVDDLATESAETLLLTLGDSFVTSAITRGRASTQVTITDNDTPGVTVTQSGGNTSVTEAGATDSYTLVLNTQPAQTVVITVVPNAQLSTSPSLLTFTPVNWNVAQAVTVTAVDDAVAEGNHNGEVAHTLSSTDPNYAAVTVAGVTASITDNDVAGVTVTQSGGTTAVTEGGANDTYTLVLTSQPTANVSIALTPNAQVTAATSPMVFTAANWNQPQTVTVTAVDDAVVEGTHSGNVAHVVTSTDTAYNGLTVAGITATITDNDNAGVTVTQSGGNTSVTEGGANDTYTLVLTSQPTANVVVAVNPNAQLTTAPSPVTFTAANWNQPQTVTVGAVDDAVAEGTHSGSIGHTVTSGDATYNGLTVAGVTATITDNDNAGVTVLQTGGNTTVTEAGASDTYELVLTSQPTAPVTVAINPDAQMTATPAVVTFTSGNWNQPQSLTVGAVNDAIAEGTHSGSIAHAVTSTDTNYNDLTVASLTATIIDNDNPGVTVTPSDGSTTVTEGGATDTYTLVLTSQPTADVTVAVAGGTQLTATPTSVIFTSATWNVAQTVTVAAIDDVIAEGTHNGSVTHTVTSTDANYQGRLVDTVSATITDNDTAGVTVTQSGGNTAVTEGGATDTVSVVLTSQPVATVTVTLTPNAQLTVSPSPLSFTAANWNVAQVVTVTAANDNVVEGTHNGSLGFGVASTDPGYGSITLPSITASITDNDSATVQFAPASVSQSEATSPMVFTVTLSNPVASGVTVKVDSTDGTALAGSDYTAVLGGSVSFPANSTTAQTVNVAITNDALDEDNETLSLTLAGIDATGNVTLGTATANGTIEDDDALPVLSVANVTQPEGNTSNTLTFTVNLSPVSGRAVSFTRATVDGTAVSSGPNADFVAIAGSTVTIPAGQTSVQIPATINGDAVFEGDESFTLSLTGITNATPGTLSATATLTEDDQQPTTTTITADLPDPSVVGQPYPVTVEVRAQTLSPLGTVSITDGTGASCNATLTAGTAPLSTMSCTLTSTTAGAKTLTATYTPATTAFGESSDTEAHQVNAAATSLVLLGPARARIGTVATYTAELSVTAPGAGTPAGTVTVSAGSNSCTITLPTATPSCGITYTTLGSRAVSAVFAPSNGNFVGSTATPVQTLVFASADVSVTKTNAVATYRPGDLLVYTVTVRNNGPDAAPQVRIRDVAPAGLTNVAWTCEASGAAICPDSGGTGTLDHVVATLPTGGVLTYAYFGNVIGRPLEIVNVAEVTLPADTTIEDPNLANNSATDTDQLDDLFANGFEAPAINVATGNVRLPAASLRSSLDDVARVTVRLSDVRGEALRVYARVVGGELQVALAVRGADGSLRLGAWQRAAAEPELVWTATEAAGGFVLSSATLR